MTIIALETSGSTCGATVITRTQAAGWQVLSCVESMIPAIHEEALVTVLETSLLLAHHTLDTVQAIALSAGPGSFTGLRIGASFVKGLCFDGRLSMLAIPTSDALAHAAARRMGSQQQEIVTAIAANRDLVYAGVFHPDGSPHTTVMLLPSNEARQLCGPGRLVVGPAGTSLAASQASGIDHLSSRWIAECASSWIEAGAGWTDVPSFEPDYRQAFVGNRS
jgi:tRNA threonylcarbamoyladenosine biosynthesis protein TsaB